MPGLLVDDRGHTIIMPLSEFRVTARASLPWSSASPSESSGEKEFMERQDELADCPPAFACAPIWSFMGDRMAEDPAYCD